MTTDTPATSLPARKRKPDPTIGRAPDAVAEYHALVSQAAPDQRPYILESANFTTELHRQRDAATSEIDAIDAAVLDISLRMERDIAAIRDRAEAEILGRTQRADDLRVILAMTARALDIQP